MDNHGTESSQEKIGEIYESEIRTTETTNIIPEETKHACDREENGHIIMEHCVTGDNSIRGDSGSELACIDIILPTLEEESSVQNEHVQEINKSSAISYENTKQNQYELEQDQGDDQSSHNKIVDLDNLHIIDDDNERDLVENQTQALEIEGNQVMHVHQDQVIVQSMETLNYEDNNTINESDDDNERHLKSHVKENEETSAVATATLEVKHYELDRGENSDLNPDEYSDHKVTIGDSQFDNIHHETITEYISKEYVANKEEERGLKQSNRDDTPIDLNHEYEHLNTTPEMHLTNEQVAEGESITIQHQLKSNFESDSEEASKYSGIRDISVESITEINEEKRTATYRQENIINIAAASANIDIQEDTRSSEIMVDQSQNQFVHNEAAESSIEENVSIILNSQSEGDVSVGDSVDNRAGGEMVLIQKEGEENASEVIEEVYFIQDVSSCGNNNFEQNKDMDNVEEDFNEEEYQVEIVQSQIINQQEDKVDLKMINSSSIAENSKISAKSRNVIQDIFDDWGDEIVDDDNQFFSTNEHDTVEIELNNLLNENKKKIPVSSKETQIQGTSKKITAESTISADVKSPVTINSTENQTTTGAEIVSSSSSPNSSTLSKKKVTARNLTHGKDIPSYVQPYVRGTYSSPSSTILNQDQDWGTGSNSKRKMQLPRLGVKVPSRHLKSQIASPAEVTEVLKERLREKQKDLESPQAADIVFVKKLTQRFASKICAGGTLPVPGLIPLSQPARVSSNTCDNSENKETSVNTTTINHTTQSNENTDNRELLAILEGDVDPDWSNLKSHSTVISHEAMVTTECPEKGDSKNYSKANISNSSGSSSSNILSKLNPTTERELALKQLLEMPSSGNKRSKKKIFKSTSKKREKIEKMVSSQKCDYKKDETKEKHAQKFKVEATTKPETGNERKESLSTSSTRKPLKENDSQNTSSKVSNHIEIRAIDETRSGRKRKPTEKALEQYATKRQKIYKPKSPNKGGLEDVGIEEKSPENSTEKDLNRMQKNSNSSKNKSFIENSKDTTVITPMSSISSSPPSTPKKVTSKQMNTTVKKVSTSMPSIQALTPQSPSPKKDKILAEKKLSLNLVKEKFFPTPSLGTRKKLIAGAASKLIPQRVLTLKKKSSSLSSPTNLQSTPVMVSVKRPVGRPSKVTVSKSAIVKGGGSGRGKGVKKLEVEKPKRKRRAGIKEIDRLLQDEGVVNLLYDVGQPRKKRLVPITKSQKKVMDIEKAERDLDIRKKLVKNAVLGLRGSDVEIDRIALRTKRRKSPLVNITTTAEVEENSVVGTALVTDNRSKSSTITSSTEFIYPAKIRNAADASVIIRRHSSSSFSSVSGSPRVSIDAPLEGGGGGSNKPDDETSHGLRSATKRKHSSVVVMVANKDTKNHHSDFKKSKQQKTSQNFESTLSSSSKEVLVETNVSKDKISSAKKQKKALIVDKCNIINNNKKIQKNSRSSSDASEGNSSSGGDDGSIIGNSETRKVCKVVTRSNGSSGFKKMLPKNQRKKTVFKEKSASALSIDNSVSTAIMEPEEGEETTVSQDELSACLAEAATALLSVSSNGSDNDEISTRTKVGGTVISSRKNKGSTSVIISHIKNELSKPFLFGNNKEFKISRNGNLVQMILTPSSSKIINGITLEVMQELCDVLTILKTDSECRVVLLTSSGGTSFCEGLDLSTLLHTDKEKRKIYAEKMANAVKEFIKCLATFNKPLVAGVQGAAIGLGVTILPLFDLVIASDKATFSTPYGKLGQIPEGAAIMTLSHVHGSAVASELLLGGRTLTANEALRAGLVTRVLWPDRFPLELLPSVKAMSDQSSQSMEATKALLRQSLQNKLNAALESETHILVQHWCSAECQEAIKEYINRKIERM